VAAFGMVLALVGAAFWLRQGAQLTDVVPRGGAAVVTGSAPAPSPAAKSAPWRPGAPRSIYIGRLGVRSPVQPIRAAGSALTPPSDPAVLGWWADGARPGDPKGSVLVTGHTVSTGGAALDLLEALRPGDAVTVRTRRDVLEYAVRRVSIIDKGLVAKQAERLFSQEVPSRLVLVTCGDWDGTRHRSNVVVTAEPVGSEHP
jgi:LPXTG-site transpeptidase (sortase) family protein